jgi:hypothetical protein
VMMRPRSGPNLLDRRLLQQVGVSAGGSETRFTRKREINI